MATDKKIKLNGADDWKAFDNGFIARADAAHLWNEKINPDNVDANGISQLKPFMTEPEEPDPTTYDKRIMPGQATPANSTRSSSTVATSAEQLDPQGRPKNANEMTLESRTAYNSDYAKYVNRLARYREEDKNVKELKTWILDSVSDHLVDTACTPGKGLDIWYKELREQVGTTSAQVRKMARERYRAAVKPLNKPPRDMQKWLMAWEEAISYAIKQDVADVAQAADWWDDFDRAVRSIAPTFRMWCQAYALNHQRALENNTVTYKEVANAFTAELRRDDNVHAGPRKIQKGAHVEQ